MVLVPNKDTNKDNKDNKNLPQGRVADMIKAFEQGNLDNVGKTYNKDTVVIGNKYRIKEKGIKITVKKNQTEEEIEKEKKENSIKEKEQNDNYRCNLGSKSAPSNKDNQHNGNNNGVIDIADYTFEEAEGDLDNFGPLI